MARKKPKSSIVAPTQNQEAVTGPLRYNATRFLSDCCDSTWAFLKGEWAEGNQLGSRKVPVDALPAVVILSSYARQYGVELVDDFDALLERYNDNMRECSHPDKFFASCVVILSERGQVPDDASFESIRIPEIYEELFP